MCRAKLPSSENALWQMLQQKGFSIFLKPLENIRSALKQNFPENSQVIQIKYYKFSLHK
jgi:hypothetical protein